MVLGSEARSLIVPHLGAPREAKMGDERSVPGCEAGLRRGGEGAHLEDVTGAGGFGGS